MKPTLVQALSKHSAHYISWLISTLAPTLHNLEQLVPPAIICSFILCHHMRLQYFHAFHVYAAVFFPINITLTTLYIVTLVKFVVVLADEYITLNVSVLTGLLRYIFFILLPLLTPSFKFTTPSLPDTYLHFGKKKLPVCIKTKKQQNIDREKEGCRISK